MSENPQLSPPAPNRIEDRVPKPPGVIPKHAQSLVIIGVAVLMILIMWLTGGGKKAALPKPVTPPSAPVSPTDASKVQDFKQAIQSEQQSARRAVAAPDASQAGAFNIPGAYGGFPQPNGPLPAGADQPPAGGPPMAGYPPGPAAGQAGSTPPEDQVKAERKKRQYLSLFASNVALTYRQGEEAEKLTGAGAYTNGATGAPGGPVPSSAGLSQDPEAEYLRQLQALSATPPLPSAASVQAAQSPAVSEKTDGGQSARAPQVAQAAKPVNPDSTEPGAFNRAGGKKYVLFEGTVIETVLINRLDGSFAGPVNCLVTTDVYSHDRQHVLIPAGSKVLGEAAKVNTFGQQRLAMAFHRLLMPDGYSVSLDQFKGLDQIGATALRDKVNNHYLQIFGASLAVGILGGIAQAGTGDILTQSALERAQAGFGQSLALAGMQILDRFLNILPTITIREGQRVKVYLSGDLLLPDYAQHDMSPDL